MSRFFICMVVLIEHLKINIFANGDRCHDISLDTINMDAGCS